MGASGDCQSDKRAFRLVCLQLVRLAADQTKVSPPQPSLSMRTASIKRMRRPRCPFESKVMQCIVAEHFQIHYTGQLGTKTNHT